LKRWRSARRRSRYSHKNSENEYGRGKRRYSLRNINSLSLSNKKRKRRKLAWSKYSKRSPKT